MQGSRRRGLDPHAVLAVARVEGLSGGIGDQGTSHGPFQLHVGGAFPTRLAGLSGQQRQAWAESQQGINYALDRIASVARGRRGRDAVAAIVSRFERPADIPGEIAKAYGLYGGTPPMASGGPTRPPVGIPGAGGGMSGLSPEVLSVINTGNAMFGLNPLSAMVQVPQIRRSASVQALSVGNVKPPPRRSGKTIKFLEHFAAPFGVQITSTTSGHHVKGSYHYKGRAVDFGGDPGNMAQLARAALTHPQDFTEMFYTGPGHPGYYIKDGRAYSLSSLDRSVYDNHTDHVHLAR